MEDEQRQRTPGNRRRVYWVDGARGVAIILVIFFHAASLLRFGAGTPALLSDINAVMAPYRMHLLTFMAGYIAHLSYRKPYGEFIRGKLRTLIWPYFIWTIVFAFTAGAGYTPLNHELYFSYLWYLLFLFVYLMWGRTAQGAQRFVYILACITLAAAIPLGIETPERFFYLAAFFFMGLVAFDNGTAWTAILTSRWTWLLALPAIWLSALSVRGMPVKYDTAWLAAALAGVILLCKMSHWFFLENRGRLFQYIGSNSIVFFVSHVPVIYCIVRINEHIGLDPYVVFAANVTIAIAAGFLLCWLRRQIPIVGLLFAWPRTRSGFRLKPDREGAPT